MCNLPHHAFKHNETWLWTLLIGWAKLLCLTVKLARAEPKAAPPADAHPTAHPPTAAAPACDSKPTGPGHTHSPTRSRGCA
jgi:hypothetical protein